MSIVGATLLGRSISTSDLDLTAQTDKIRNQLRYAQAQAIKTAYKDYPVWGIKSANGQYWLFRGTAPETATNEVRLPGMDYSGTSNRISTASLGVTMNNFTVFFDRIGKPYKAYTNDSINEPVSISNPLTVAVTPSGGGPGRSISITPETGLAQ